MSPPDSAAFEAIEMVFGRRMMNTFIGLVIKFHSKAMADTVILFL